MLNRRKSFTFEQNRASNFYITRIRIQIELINTHMHAESCYQSFGFHLPPRNNPHLRHNVYYRDMIYSAKLNGMLKDIDKDKNNNCMLHVLYMYTYNLTIVVSRNKSYFRLSLIHISEPTRPLYISYAVFCLKKNRTCRMIGAR